MLGTMADAYANSIMVDALILGREGTIVVPENPTPPPASLLRAGIAGTSTTRSKWNAGSRGFAPTRRSARCCRGSIFRRLVTDSRSCRPHLVDCGNRTSAEVDVRGSRFRWCLAGPNCVTNAPPKSWRRSTRSTLSGRRSSTCIPTGPSAHSNSSTWCCSSACTWKCASSMRSRAGGRSNTTRRCSR